MPSRWFTFNAGLGFDAGVVGRVEQQRERGRRSTHALYVRQAVRQFFGEPHRRHGTITLERPGADPVDRSGAVHSLQHRLRGRFWAIVRCTRRLRPRSIPGSTYSVSAACRRLRLPGMRTQLLTSSPERGPHGKHAVSLHDLTDFTLHSKVPLPLQMDGDHLGLRTSVTFTGVRRALRVIV